MTITMQPYKSSQVESAGYDPSTGTLAVKYRSGATYNYANVTPEVFAAMNEAESVGKFIGKEIKGKFDYWKQPEEKEDK